MDLFHAEGKRQQESGCAEKQKTYVEH